MDKDKISDLPGVGPAIAEKLVDSQASIGKKRKHKTARNALIL